MSQSALTKSAPPWFHLLVAAPSDACDWLWALEHDSKQKLAARLIRGRKSATAASFFDEVAAALQFPHYFGENWNALNDCLTDLSWLPAQALVLCIADADQLLAKTPADLKWLIDVLQSAAKEWNHPEKPKTPRAFHVVLQVALGHEEVVKTPWQAAGVKLEPVASIKTTK
jgi:RNAse (barnase) inhibitor barstar